MYKKLPKNTPALLRKHGLKVVEVDGWYDRGRPASTGELNPVGVLCHHTATTKSTSIANVLTLLKKGRSDLPGPLCHFSLGRDGTVYIVAAGRANHAGKAKASGTVGAGDGNKLYWGIEAMNDGRGEPWPTAQYNAYVLLCAVLCVELTHNSEKTVRGHKETSVTGKIDPLFNMTTFRSKVAAKMKAISAPAPVAPAKPAAPSTPGMDFQVVLVPGNNKQSVGDVVADLAQVNKVLGTGGLVANTERQSQPQRNAVAKGLGSEFTRVHDNEVTTAYGHSWHSVGSRARLLAKDDPAKAKVSPNRYLNTELLQNKALPGVTLAFKGTHLVSEANCEHINVFGRAWRVKTWRIQINDVIADCHDDIAAGHPVVLAGDFNTGVMFPGARLFKRLQTEFGVGNVVHAYNSTLDHIFLISTPKVKLTKVGQVSKVNNHSDHDSARVKVHAAVR